MCPQALTVQYRVVRQERNALIAIPSRPHRTDTPPRPCVDVRTDHPKACHTTCPNIPRAHSPRAARARAARPRDDIQHGVGSFATRCPDTTHPPHRLHARCVCSHEPTSSSRTVFSAVSGDASCGLPFIADDQVVCQPAAPRAAPLWRCHLKPHNPSSLHAVRRTVCLMNAHGRRRSLGTHRIIRVRVLALALATTSSADALVAPLVVLVLSSFGHELRLALPR